MTMQYDTHPDDERLAAYASADREAVSDRELAAHIDGCDRCGPFVDELDVLRDALAFLPDIAPSRPLRLIPPVAEPAARRSGTLEWLHRLAAPAMVAGAGLVLVGAVGASGITGQLGTRLSSKDAAGPSALPEANASDVAGRPATAPSGSPKPAPGTATGGGTFGSVSSPPRDLDSDGGASPPSSQGEGAFGPLSHASGDQPWLPLVVAGFGLLGVSAILRYSLTPRAG